MGKRWKIKNKIEFEPIQIRMNLETSYKNKSKQEK